MKKTDLETRIKELELELSNLKSGVISTKNKTKQATNNTLEENDAKFLTLANYVQAYIAYVNMDTLRYEFVNDLYEKSFGIPREKIIGSHMRDVVGEKNYQSDLKYINEVKSGQSVSYENTFDMTSGKKWLSVNLSPVFDANGKIVGIALVSYDITERRQCEEKIHLKSEIISNMSEAISLVRIADGIIVYVHSHFEKMFGYKQGEILGKHVSILNAPTEKSPEQTAKEIIDYLNKNGFWQGEVENIRKDGTFFTCYASITIFDHSKFGKVAVSIQTDITQRKQAEKALHENEIRYRELFNHISNSVAIYEVKDNGNDFIFKDFNRAGEQMDGDRKEDIIGKSIYEVRPNIKKFGLLEVFKRVFATGIPERYLDRFYIDEHLQAWYDNYIYRLPSGEIVAIYDNITKRKQEEQELKESAIKWRTIIDLLPIGVSLLGENHNLLDYNQALLDILDISKEDLEKGIYNRRKYYHLDNRQVDVEEFPSNIAMKKNKPILNKELVILKEDGEKVWVEVSAVPLSLSDIKCIILTANITERKKAEKDLHESEEEFRIIMENSADAIFVTNQQGEYVYTNKAVSEMLGYTTEEMKSKTITDISSPKRKEEDLKFFKQILSEGRGFTEIELLKKDGNCISTDLNTTLLPNGLIYGSCRDITERKNYEKKLIKAKEKAEESDRLKSAFLTNMSHEIRTPMNGILGFAELLKEPNLTSNEQQDYLQTMQISGARLLNTINSIVDISKIESGLVTVDIEVTNINEKMEFVYKFFKPEVEIKGLKFLFRNGLSSNEAIIKTDNEKVYAILTNLVKNAIKFTFDGSIEFGYEKKGECLEFYVKDTGVGIPQKQYQMIFERFRQGSESHNRGYEGSGLGLSIAKSYIEMLGGKIWMESEEGKGSSFYFTIPYNAVSEEKTELIDVIPEEHKEVAPKRLKILIVEDDEISYTLLTRMLQNISYEVLHVISGEKAIEACRNNHDLDLILMDIRMPMMDGLEATRKIRKFNKDVVIIAQTAYGFSSDRDKAIEAGCNDYISKPISKISLIGLILKYFNK